MKTPPPGVLSTKLKKDEICNQVKPHFLINYFVDIGILEVYVKCGIYNYIQLFSKISWQRVFFQTIQEQGKNLILVVKKTHDPFRVNITNLKTVEY